MSLGEFQRQLDLAEKARREKVAVMEQLRQTIINEVCRFALDWGKKRAEKICEESPDLILALGMTGLKALKNDLRKLDASIPMIVAECLGGEQYWPDCTLPDARPRDAWVASNLKESFTKEFQTQLRCVLGAIGNVLIEHNVVRVEDPKVPEWEKWADGHVQYAGTINESEALRQAVENYCAEIKDLVEITSSVMEARYKKTQAEARSLWDQVG
ncbi:MAG: hypothetical protein ABSH14_06755 [Verrucomicrobiia bacterium]